MGLKIRINYQWQLFIPLSVTLCIVFGLIVWYQYKRESDYRAEIYCQQLDLVNRSVMKAYDTDRNLRPFISFINSYFDESRFRGVRVTVYSDDGIQLYSLGVPMPFDVKDLNIEKTFLTGGESQRVQSLSPDGNRYLSSRMRSSDNQIVAVTAFPIDNAVEDAISIDSTVWLVIAACLLVTLVVTYYFTRRLARNVVLLKDFAYRAATGGRFTGLDKFPKNELGDISREIITLYRERGNAIDQIKKERKVAIHALMEKVRVTRQMTNNINHEIKTPVGIIRGYLESILGDPDMDAETRNTFLERMLTNIERLSTLLNDISTMTRLENGKDKIAVTKVDMYDLVFQIDCDIEVNRLAGDLEFTYDLPMDCCVGRQSRSPSGHDMRPDTQCGHVLRGHAHRLQAHLAERQVLCILVLRRRQRCGRGAHPAPLRALLPRRHRPLPQAGWHGPRAPHCQEHRHHHGGHHLGAQPRHRRPGIHLLAPALGRRGVRFGMQRSRQSQHHCLSPGRAAFVPPCPSHSKESV